VIAGRGLASLKSVDERLWFSNTVEGLFLRGLAGRLTPSHLDVLKQRGIDLSRRLAPAYPAALFAECIRLTAREVFPTVDEVEGVRRLGQLFLSGYQQTLVGAALVQMMKLLGARRTLQRMERNFATGGNFMKTQFTSHGPGDVEVSLSEVDGIPSYFAGIIEKGSELVNAKNYRVTYSCPDGHLCRVHVKWEET
jgi:uncharacterized protein (TIGR02265 family)